MPQRIHTQQELDAIRAFTVPTLANALELFDALPRNSGYCDSSIKCHYPGLPMMVGYAVTLRVSADLPPSPTHPAVHLPDYWRYLASQPGPKVAVVQDIDNPPRGAIWGEWNANVHKALGCVGMVTDGAARDLDGVQKLGFHFFSTHVLPVHAFSAIIDYGGSVRVAGMVVNPGDLLVGDLHGVLFIPAEVPLLELAQVARRIDELESEIFALCQSPEFSVEALASLDASVHSRWPMPTPKV